MTWSSASTRPRRALLVGAAGALVVLALVVLAGCGGGPGTTRSGGGTGVPPSEAPTPTPMPDETEPTSPAPPVVEAVAGTRERAASWRFVRARGSTVLVEVDLGGPPCDAVTGLEVTESADVVGLLVWTGPVSGARCAGQPAVLGTVRVEVRLDAPLAGRRRVAGGRDVGRPNRVVRPGLPRPDERQSGPAVAAPGTGR